MARLESRVGLVFKVSQELRVLLEIEVSPDKMVRLAGQVSQGERERVVLA